MTSTNTILTVVIGKDTNLLKLLTKCELRKKRNKMMRANGLPLQTLISAKEMTVLKDGLMILSMVLSFAELQLMVKGVSLQYSQSTLAIIRFVAL